VTHSLTGALRGAIAVVIANQSPKKYDNLMPLTPWNP
jgi:nitrite reductase (NO-forming)